MSLISFLNTYCYHDIMGIYQYVCHPFTTTRKHVFFLQITIAEKVSTTDNLRRRGLTATNILDTCVMCWMKKDIVNHLFLHCEVEASVWSNFIARCGIAWCMPQLLARTVESWIGGHFAGCGRILLRLTLFAILWSI